MADAGERDRVRVRPPVFQVECFFVVCQNGSLSYAVFWVGSGGSGDPVAEAVYRQMTSVTLQGNFTLTNEPGIILGEQARGYLTSGYDCVWGYARYPIAMLIHGTDPTSTEAACQASTFYDASALASRMPS